MGFGGNGEEAEVEGVWGLEFGSEDCCDGAEDEVVVLLHGGETAIVVRSLGRW